MEILRRTTLGIICLCSLVAVAEDEPKSFAPTCGAGESWVVKLSYWSRKQVGSPQPEDKQWEQSSLYYLFYCEKCRDGQITFAIHLDMRIYDPFNAAIETGRAFSPVSVGRVQWDAKTGKRTVDLRKLTRNEQDYGYVGEFLVFIPQFRQLAVSKQGSGDQSGTFIEHHLFRNAGGKREDVVLFLREEHKKFLEERKSDWLDQRLPGDGYVVPQVVQHWIVGRPWWSRCEVLRGEVLGKFVPQMAFEVVSWNSKDKPPTWGDRDLVESQVKASQQEK